jgi:hypothetical protein
MTTEVDSAPTGSKPARSEHNNDAPQFEKFVELPVEIREKIYEEVMLARDYRCRVYTNLAFPRQSMKHLTNGQPAVCFTSKNEGYIAYSPLCAEV